MDAPKPSYHEAPTRPSLRLPRGSCDAHVHVFGPAGRFPFDPGSTFFPADAPKERLFALHDFLGIERCVIVQSVCHGFDNSAVADALGTRSGRYRGIARVPMSVSDNALRALHVDGFRGLRFNFGKELGPAAPIEAVIALTKRLAPLDWNLQVHFDSELIDDLSPWFLRSSVPVVIDHMGRVNADRGLGQAGFQSLLRLLDDQRMWIKLSGADRVSRTGAPYQDAIPFARMLVERFGDRVVWGTDWPHPNTPTVPDDGVLTDALASIAPLRSELEALLVTNPQRLYGFEG